MRNKPVSSFIIILFLLAAPGLLFGQGYAIDYSQVDTGLYIYTSYYDMGSYKKVGANGLVIEGNDSVIVVDAPWDSAQTVQLMEWVADSLQKPIATFIITHAHDDRIGGIAQVHADGIATVSTHLTASLAPAGGFEAPRFTFYTDTTLSIAGASAEIFYPGPGHTSDNCVVYLPGSRLLYGGCFLKSAGAKNLGNLADADTEAWPASLSNLRKRYPDARMVVPGHGRWLPGAIDQTHRLLAEYSRNKEK